jgi:hypothetical protein
MNLQPHIGPGAVLEDQRVARLNLLRHCGKGQGIGDEDVFGRRRCNQDKKERQVFVHSPIRNGGRLDSKMDFLRAALKAPPIGTSPR